MARVVPVGSLPQLTESNLGGSKFQQEDEGDTHSVASSSIHSRDETAEEAEEAARQDALRGKSSFIANRNQLRDAVLKEVLAAVMPDIGAYDIDGMAARAAPEKSRIRNVLKFLGVLHLDLHEAVLSGSLRHVKSSIKNIAKKHDGDMALVNQYDEQGKTPLSLAAKIRNLDMVEVLLENDAMPDVVDEATGRTPLMFAVLGRSFQIAQLLLKYSAAVDMSDFKCVTPLMVAVSNRDLKCTELLCKNLAEVDLQDENGWTALHYASMNNAPNCLLHLLKEGADRSIRDLQKRRPLDLARFREYGDCVALLESRKLY
ncbi:ankyrin repeat-containing domain protein [Ochromonadaceae sp. CCMP2298]|nr:ankyrin repeat-containing domain protein [Ochromonadaceae sp. CCMP2298]|mmetsp:Transcript_10602/g.23532  ORF Transcript_10602/g.23532 Transcript_10602/m.23532 type:complete len:316 (-) Transcript_10602:97-1044(-)